MATLEHKLQERHPNSKLNFYLRLYGDIPLYHMRISPSEHLICTKILRLQKAWSAGGLRGFRNTTISASAQHIAHSISHCIHFQCIHRVVWNLWPIASRFFPRNAFLINSNLLVCCNFQRGLSLITFYIKVSETLTSENYCWKTTDFYRWLR